MIDIKDEMFNDYSVYGPQMSNLWEFFIDDWDEYGHVSKIKVVSTSLPFITLEQEKRHTGHHFYSGYTMPDTFSITFREDTNFSVTKYFEDWRDRVFDMDKGVFRSGVNQTKTGFIAFSTFKFKEDVNIGLKRYAIGKAENLLTQARGTVLNKLKEVTTGFLPGATQAIGRGIVQRGISEFNKKVGDLSLQPKIGELFEEVQTRSYTLYGLRYLGMSDVSLDYGNQEQLQVTVNLGMDFIKEGTN